MDAFHAARFRQESPTDGQLRDSCRNGATSKATNVAARAPLVAAKITNRSRSLGDFSYELFALLGFSL